MFKGFIQWYWATTRWVGVLYALIIFTLMAIAWQGMLSATFDRASAQATARAVEVLATPSMPGVKAK